MRLVVFDQPALPARAGEAAHQFPVRTQRRRLSRREARDRLRQGCGRRIEAGDAGHQAIAVAMHGLDQPLIIVAERLAQLRDAFCQDRFAQDPAAPDCVEQFVLGEHFAGMAQQQHEQLERLALDADENIRNPQLEGRFVQCRVAELPARQIARCLIHDCSLPRGLWFDPLQVSTARRGMSGRFRRTNGRVPDERPPQADEQSGPGRRAGLAWSQRRQSCLNGNAVIRSTPPRRRP